MRNYAPRARAAQPTLSTAALPLAEQSCRAGAATGVGVTQSRGRPESRCRSSAEGGPGGCWTRANDERLPSDDGQQLSGLGRLFLLAASRHSASVGRRARSPSGSVAQPTRAGGPIHAAAGVLGIGRGFGAGARSELGRPDHAPGARAAGCSSWGPADQPRTFRHTHGSVRIDAGWALTRVAHWRGRRCAGRRQDLRPQAADGRRDLSLLGDVGRTWAMSGQWNIRRQPQTRCRPTRPNRALSRRKANQPQASANVALHS